jgi:hypothetical protein
MTLNNAIKSGRPIRYFLIPDYWLLLVADCWLLIASSSD